MTAGVAPSDWYEAAVRRARASRKRPPESSQWPEFAPPVPLAEGPLGIVQAADREIARQTARRARAVSAFAAARPASGDRAQGEPGAMTAERWAARPEALRTVSEWAAQELVVALSISTEAAETLLTRSLALVHRLPGTLAALEAGALHPGHLWPMLEKVALIENVKVRAEVEGFLLRWAAGRVTTPAQLGAKARREVLRRDARAAARNLERAVAQRGVFWRPDAVEGMGAVTALLTLPEARALIEALGRYADAVDDEESASPAPTRGQKMADCLLDLVLRPGECDLPPVQVALTMVAPVSTALGGDEPGEVDGHPVPAEMVRALLRALTGATLPGEGPSSGVQADAHRGGAGVDGPEAGRTDPSEPVADPSEPVADPSEPVADPSEPVADPSQPVTDAEPAWTLGEEADFVAWSDEFTRRVLAGELDEPDPTTEHELAAWAADAERRILAGEPVAPLSEDQPVVCGPDPDDTAPAAPVPDRFPGGEPPDHDPSPPQSGQNDPSEPRPDASGDPSQRRTPEPSADNGSNRSRDGGGWRAPPQEKGNRSADGAGWWARADEAVTEAGLTLLRLQQATAHAWRLVRTAAAADADDESVWQAGSGGRVSAAEDALTALGQAGGDPRALLAELLHRTAGGGLADRPRIALTDAVSGALLSLTDLPGLRRAAHCGAAACRRSPESCTHDLAGRPGLGPPAATDGYRPGAALDGWVRARDRRCRFPGCRRRVPRGGELDHDRPYPAGPTDAENLVGYCTGHHRGKHQAPGWRYTLHPDGRLGVTTPTGLSAVTTPPPY